MLLTVQQQRIHYQSTSLLSRWLLWIFHRLDLNGIEVLGPGQVPAECPTGHTSPHRRRTTVTPHDTAASHRTFNHAHSYLRLPKTGFMVMYSCAIELVSYPTRPPDTILFSTFQVADKMAAGRQCRIRDYYRVICL